ncbi:MAG: hypothetical protein WCV91_06090 [Candidatus Margulisiibacteriota bacterium]
MKKLIVLIGLLLVFTCSAFCDTKPDNQEYIKLTNTIINKVILLKDTYGQMEDLNWENISIKDHPDKTVVSLYFYDKYARQIKAKTYLILGMTFTIWDIKQKTINNNIGRMEIVYSATGNEGKNITKDIKNIIEAEKDLFPLDR